MDGKRISPKTKAFVQYLKEYSNLTVNEIVEKCGVSRSTVFRSVKPKEKSNNRGGKAGRRRKFNQREERRIRRAIHSLRKREGNFTAKRLMVELGVPPMQVSVRTVQRHLHRMGYSYVHSRRKGVLTEKDRKRRLGFAKDFKRNYREEFWTEDVCFYFDGVSFFHKFNPADQARAPDSLIWRLPSEGLAPYCTAKGSHVGSGGRVVKFFVGISYKEGVVLCERYEKLNGQTFQEFIFKHFPRALKLSKKGRSRIFLQDGDPSQNSALARGALSQIKAQLFSIPPRSPDLNPIENFFHNIKNDLRNQAMDLNIEYETVDEFAQRIKLLMLNYDRGIIDRTIASTNKRIDLIIKKKGGRTKY